MCDAMPNHPTRVFTLKTRVDALECNEMLWFCEVFQQEIDKMGINRASLFMGMVYKTVDNTADDFAAG
ncbi:MAG TPA: hypothetical protein VFE47_20990 [Tepidisphaeraceae bacterium]|jgi:hypothetical protein|nr:hypothetical protein [Tepidisphaeraceae bacterium]